MIEDYSRRQLIDNIRIAKAEHREETEVLKTAVELMDEFSEGFDWTGFYMRRGGHLEVGPYIGPETPHTKIELSSGICGAAASTGESIIVGDVSIDPRFLACSASTKSEIVVPLVDGDKVIGEIDIDSNRPSFFTAEDKEMLEGIASAVVERLRQIK